MPSASNLTITDRRHDTLEEWRVAFAAMDSVHFHAKNANEIAQGSFDAIALPVMLAHQRFGSRPIIGRSQVLSTKEYSKKIFGNPRWVVTTVPFPARTEIETNAEGKNVLRVLPDEVISPDRKTRLLFKAMLHAVEEHNELYNDRIETFLIDLEAIGASSEAATLEANGAAEAVGHYMVPEIEVDDVDYLLGYDVSTTRRIVSQVSRSQQLAFEQRPRKHALMTALSTTPSGAISHKEFYVPDLFKSDYFGRTISKNKFFREFYFPTSIRNEAENFGTPFGLILDRLTETVERSYFEELRSSRSNIVPVNIKFNHNGYTYDMDIILDIRRGKVSVRQLRRLGATATDG